MSSRGCRRARATTAAEPIDLAATAEELEALARRLEELGRALARAGQLPAETVTRCAGRFARRGAARLRGQRADLA